MGNIDLNKTRKMDASRNGNEFGNEPDTVRDKSQTQPIKVKKPRRWRTILIGILSIMLIGAAGGGLGYMSGIQERVSNEKEEAITQATMQFKFGMQQLNAGNYELALTHFEFVLKTYPEFPEITEKYTEAILRLAKNTGQVAQPQATPTPDTREAEELFNLAVQQVQGRQWAEAMDTLEALRNADYTYRTLDVDGMYFTTLRHLAVQKIIGDGDLEEGLYLLAIVARFAPPDREAANYGSWARLYLTGASFWEVDWEQVVNFFSQLSAAFPNLHDGSGWTAAERYMAGLEAYGDQLADEGDPCGALYQYQTILNISAIETIQNKYNDVFILCFPPTATPEPIIITPTPTVTITPTPPSPGPELTPTVTTSPEPT